MKPAVPSKRRAPWLIASIGVIALLVLYFTLCPRFGHGGASDEEQIAALGLVGVPQDNAYRIYIVHDHALAAWPMSQDQRREEALLVKRFCRWTLVTQTDTGFDIQALHEWGVPRRDAAALYALLMEGYAESP
jgi:hypothetical protein